MAWTARHKAKWRDLIGHLESECPGPGEVSVVRRAKDRYSCTTVTAAGCRIYIRPTLQFRVAVDDLLHEFAHWMNGWKGGDRNELTDHDDAWGVAYATCYRAFLRWLANKD